MREAGKGLMIREINGKFQLCTLPVYAKYISKLFDTKQRAGLSQAAYETLAIIAYNKLLPVHLLSRYAVSVQTVPSTNFLNATLSGKQDI